MPKKLAFQIVKRRIDEWDPIGLLAMGVPDDEYDVEVMMIVERLSKVIDLRDLSKAVTDVFDEMFYDGDGTMTTEECDEVALRIWNDIMERQRLANQRRFKRGARSKSNT